MKFGTSLWLSSINLGRFITFNMGLKSGPEKNITLNRVLHKAFSILTGSLVYQVITYLIGYGAQIDPLLRTTYIDIWLMMGQNS